MKLKISESFYSVQGEGSTVGTPAVFLRLANCNLLCGGKGTIKDKKLHDGATWRCDTIETWLKGSDIAIDDLITTFLRKGYLGHLEDGAHLVITGGEPLLQQDALIEFLGKLKKTLNVTIKVELETNGTIKAKKELLMMLDYIHISIKLSNSGMPLEKRFTMQGKEFIKELMTNWQGIDLEFKVVISTLDDINELRDFASNLLIKNKMITLMPAASNRDQLEHNLLFCVEYAKKYHYKISSRLQIEIWNRTVGV